jgi:agmatine deiminase
MPAEWEAREGTLMAWPVRDEAWLGGLAEARDGFVEVANAISEFERVVMIARPGVDADGYACAADARKRLSSSIEIWELPHDDSWLRDNGPTFLLDGAGNRAAVNWRFNAWGEKYRPYDADDRLAPLILERLGVRRYDAPLVLEGGSIHVDGAGTLLTTEECLLAANRNPGLSQAEIESLLREYLGVTSFIWLDRGLAGDETDGHVDNLACFVRPGLVAMQATSDRRDPNFLSSERNLRILMKASDATGKRLDIVTLEQPPARSHRGEALTLSYINYYPVSGGLIVPTFASSGGQDMALSDEQALGVLRELYPDRKIVPIDGMRIIKGGGNVHCITQQIPAAGGNA